MALQPLGLVLATPSVGLAMSFRQVRSQHLESALRHGEIGAQVPDGVTDHFWELADMVRVLEAWGAQPE